jgi:UDP-GlcNAc3NAcA epimerase
MSASVLTIIGARPQFIKAATISRAIAANGRVRETIIHTGQHFDREMSEVFITGLGIPEPEEYLDVHGGGHGAMTGRMLELLEPIVEARRPDLVLVYGDANSTIAGALVAAKLHVPVAHVEAGLRSFNRSMPEEVNRVLTDHVSTLLFCPTRTAVDNLAREGISTGVHHVGDVMYDAMRAAVARARETSTICERLDLHPGGYALATVHRAENTATRDDLARALDYLKAHAKERPVVLPLHPRTRKAAGRFGLDFEGLLVAAPVDYLDMTALLDGCAVVLTDSGGLQKEAYFHRKPCVTMRSETEWVETVEGGWNRLWCEPHYRPRKEITDYGHGQAARRIVECIDEYLCGSEGLAKCSAIS